MSATRRLVPRLPRDAWIVLTGDMMSAVGSGLTLPFLLVYLNRVRGIELGVAGFAVAAVAMVGLVGNPFGGWLTDRLGSRSALACGLVVAATGAFSVTAVHESWQAFASAALIGTGGAIVWPAQDALLATVVRPEQRSSVFAVRNATLNAGYAVGAVGAAVIADLSSPGSFVTLYVLDGLTFLAFVPVLGLIRVDVTARSLTVPGQRGGYGTVLRDGAFVRVWVLFVVLVAIGFSQTTAAFPVYATGPGGIGASGVGVAFAANTVTVLAIQLVVFRLMAGRRRTTGIALACLCWGGAWALTLVAGGIERSELAVVAFAAVLVVFGVGETLLAPSQAALVNDLAPDDLRGRYNGLYTLSWTVGLSIGPAVAGVMLAAHRGNELFLGLAVACACCAVAALRLSRHLPEGLDLVTPGA